MSDISIKYEESIQKVHQSLVARKFSGTELGELEAAVCHWLMNGQVRVPFMNHHQRNFADGILQTVAGDEGSSDKISEAAGQLSFEIDYSDIPYPPPRDPQI